MFHFPRKIYKFIMALSYVPVSENLLNWNNFLLLLHFWCYEQFIMGLCHFGSLIKFIPYTITTGFTSGIAVTIVIGQLKDFFGITYQNGETPIETIEKLEAVFKNFSTFNINAWIIGIISLAILIITPYIFKKIPGSLIAVIAALLCRCRRYD